MARLLAAVRKFLLQLRDDARALIAGGPVFLAAVLGLTALQWLARYAVLWVALAVLGQRIPFAAAFLLQSFVLHAAQWTGIPAGGGGAELGMGAALATAVPAVTLATALLLWRLATVHASLAAGALAILWLVRRPRIESAAAQSAAAAG